MSSVPVGMGVVSRLTFTPFAVAPEWLGLLAWNLVNALGLYWAVSRLLPRLQAYLAQIAGYERNLYELPPEKRAEITRRWGPVIHRYGYGKQEVEVVTR